MKSAKMNVLCCVLLSSLVVTSCGEEDEFAEDVQFTAGEAVNDVAVMDNNLVHEWTNLFLELERYSTGRPNASARGIAYIYLAGYETAVPAMLGYASNDDRLRGLRIRDDERADEINWELALNATFATAIDHFLLNLPTSQRNAIAVRRVEVENELVAGLSDEVIANSNAWGEYVAQQVIVYSQADDEAEEQILEPQPLSYEPPIGEGYWTYSADPERALFPYWESARTFVISPNRTSSVPPIAYSETPGSPYYQQMLDAYNANNSAREEDGEQLWIAEFWSDDVEGLMMSPPARQVSIANQLIDQKGMSLQESLVMMLKLGFSLNDAAVAAWKYKYEYMVMRPSVYIQDLIDPSFQTNLYRLIFWPNPGFPGYPSGHSTFASAAAGVFIDYFGDHMEFTDRTHEGRDEFRGAPRTFSTLSDMAEENAFSRVPFGVHIDMDCVEGLRLGYEISDAINELDLFESNRQIN